MSFIFGGSKSKQQSTSQQSSQSFNQAYPYIQETYSPIVSQGNKAFSSLSALLGLGGDRAGAESAYDDYLGSTDYNRTLRTGSQAITNNRAVNGLLGSGSTLRALTQFGQDTSQKYFGDYLNRLLGISDSGMKAGNLIAGAGNTASSIGSSQSTGTSSNANGFGGLFGSLISSIAR